VGKNVRCRVKMRLANFNVPSLYSLPCGCRSFAGSTLTFHGSRKLRDHVSAIEPVYFASQGGKAEAVIFGEGGQLITEVYSWIAFMKSCRDLSGLAFLTMNQSSQFLRKGSRLYYLRKASERPRTIKRLPLALNLIPRSSRRFGEP
jgi:hypothetical protein